MSSKVKSCLCLPSFPPELSSKLESIFLIFLFNSTYKKIVGNAKMLKNLISEIKHLEQNSIEIYVNGQLINLYFSLALIVGDNLGLHSIMGFSESFVANYPCRFCQCSKAECHIQLHQIDNQLRSLENYEINVNIRNVSQAGIIESCVWNNIDSFHAINNYLVDIMHDLLEGVCCYDIFGILRYFVIEMKLLLICVIINTNSLLVFGLLKYLYISSDNQPFTIYTFLETIGFNEHFQAYNVVKTSNI